MSSEEEQATSAEPKPAPAKPKPADAAAEGETADAAKKSGSSLLKAIGALAARKSSTGESGSSRDYSAPSSAGGGKNITLVLVIVGLIEYLLKLYYGPSTVLYAISLLLFIFAGYALAAKLEKDRVAILIPMLIFVVWYFIFGGNYDPIFLLYFGVVVLGISLLIGLLTKGNSVKPELVGLIPVTIFFLDIGLIPLLVEKLHLPLTPLLQTLILFMPWWVFLGVFTLPTEGEKGKILNAFIGIARFAGIVYLVFVFVIAAIPDIGYNTALLPSAGEFEAAQARVRAQLPKTENPFISQMACIFSEPQDVVGCVQRRQEASEVNYECGERQQLVPGTPKFNECAVKYRENKQKTAISGAIDPTRKPTTAEFKESPSFPKLTSIRAGDVRSLGYPMELEINNPRTQNFNVQILCNFTKKDSRAPESFLGRIEGGNEQGSIITVSQEVEKRTFICSPPTDKVMNGNYKLTYTAQFYGLSSTSRLQKAFIGSKDQAWKDANLPKIMATYFSDFSGNNKLSQGPADFARINFALGNPVSEPIVESGRSLVVTSFVENLARGKITSIHSYDLGLESEGFSAASADCLQSTNVAVSQNILGEKIPLSYCIVNSLPSEFANPPEEYTIKEFRATVVYDYALTKDMDIEVRLFE